MNYILATDTTIIEYPYSVEKLRSDNPQTSFPVVMTEADLKEWGVYTVTIKPQPSVNEKTEKAEKATPSLINGSWMVDWVISEVSLEEQAQRTAKKAAEIRAFRDQTLKNSDFTQLPDYPGDENIKEQFRVFRQLLRDMPNQIGFPWDATYPTPPPKTS